MAGSRGVAFRAGSPSRWRSIAVAATVLVLAGCGPNVLFSWGRASEGQLGLGVTGVPHPAPAQVGGITWKAVSTSATGDHACGITGNDTLWCWGANAAGQLGDGTTTDHPTPTEIGTQTWASVDAGDAFTLALVPR